MRHLVTGGLGFVGTNLSEHILTRGHTLSVLDNCSRTGCDRNLEYLQSVGAFTFHKNDVRDFDKINAIIRDFSPDVIYHMAGQVAMTSSIDDPRNDFETNVGGTINILEAVRLNRLDSHILFSSSNKVYGDLEDYNYVESETRYLCSEAPNGFDESTPLDFRSPYGCSKGAAEQYVLDYHRVYGLKTTVFRHSSMYGGRQFSSFDQGWLGWFAKCALLQKADGSAPSFTVAGNGKQVRDLLHAHDVLSLYQTAAHNERAYGQVFNIGGGPENSKSILEYLAWLEKQLDMKLRVKHLVSRPSDQKIFVADTRKALNILDWKPKVKPDEGLVGLLSWTGTLT